MGNPVLPDVLIQVTFPQFLRNTVNFPIPDRMARRLVFLVYLV